jgi:dipeptidyl aminopeptidase/acylaminoacyl peptidase
MAFTYQDPDTPADVHVSPVRHFQMSKVTDVHAGVPRPAMGRTTLLSWISPDGRKIEGLLTYPVDYREGRRYPLILNVHGGPAGVYTQSFTGSPSIYMIQYFAEEGYAVLRPNPRGSSGYGKEFRYANVRDWGYGDFEDLMSGVDKVVDMGVAHADSLLLMGWSYGGYMTSFAVTKTDRFKAASMGAGLPNLISMTTTTDIPDYLVAHMGAEFWEDYDVYEKHSAMYRIANVVTPTQVIHGKNDDRVPMRQGQEFYVALKRRGVSTEMIVYPRTPHGPREPKFVMDVSVRIMTWFEKHLGREQKEPEAVTPAGGGKGR